jgi:hypothetical protein
LNAKQIRRVANLLGMKPIDLINKLKEEDKKDGFFTKIVESEEEFVFSKKIEVFAKMLGKWNPGKNSQALQVLMEDFDKSVPKIGFYAKILKIKNYKENSQAVQNLINSKENSQAVQNLINYFEEPLKESYWNIPEFVWLIISAGLLICVICILGFLIKNEIATTIVLVVLAFSLIILILMLCWKLCTTLSEMTKIKKSRKRHAIKEIVKTIKLLDDD